MPRPGLRTGLYLDRFTFTRKPSVSSLQRNESEDTERARDLTLYRDALQPAPGYPKIVTKLSLTLAWPTTMTGLDIRKVNDMIAIRGPFDVCPWEEISEAYWIDAGEPFAGYLTRRNALTVISPLPVGAATEFAVTAERGDGSALTVTLGTPDALGVTPWSASGTSTGENVVVRYPAVYRMWVVSDQPTFSNPHLRSETLGLEEA